MKREHGFKKKNPQTNQKKKTQLVLMVPVNVKDAKGLRFTIPPFSMRQDTDSQQHKCEKNHKCITSDTSHRRYGVKAVVTAWVLPLR